MFEHSQSPAHAAIHGGGDRPPDPAAALARKIVSRDEHAALGGRIRLALGNDELRTASLRLGMDYHSVRRILRGAKASPEFLRRLCQAYNVDGHWLITGDGLMHPDARASGTLSAVSPEALIAELSRRLRLLLGGAGNAPLEAAMRHGQQALDALRAELPQPP